MKKKVLSLAVVAICAAILASGTLAYFSVEGEYTNIITTGGVDILLEEWQQTEHGLIPYPADKPIVVMPGTRVSKIATVRSTQQKAYIRAKVAVSVFDADKKPLSLPAETLDSIISLTMNTTDWTRKDGDSEWWYYNTAVANGDATQALFTEVVFDGPKTTNEYQNCTVEIVVTAQGVQVANNGNTAVEALGWPVEEQQ